VTRGVVSAWARAAVPAAESAEVHCVALQASSTAVTYPSRGDCRAPAAHCGAVYTRHFRPNLISIEAACAAARSELAVQSVQSEFFGASISAVALAGITPHL
jgi:hypothetical protein